MRSVVIVVVLPFAKSVVEQADVIGDAILVEQQVKLLLVHTKAGRSRSDLEHTDARAVIDGRELMGASPGPVIDSLEELHVDLQAMSGLWFFVSMPGTTRRLALLLDRQPVHSIADEYSMNGGTCHIHVVNAIQIAGNPSRPQPVTLSQI